MAGCSVGNPDSSGASAHAAQGVVAHEEVVVQGGEDVQALLQDVASMSDSDVEELMEQLKRGAV